MASAASIPEAGGRRMFAWWLAIPLAVLLFAMFAAVNIALLQKGFASKSLLYLGEKALLVFHGRPPRLENLGFVYPPLPYLFVLLFRDALWAGAFVGTVAACGFLLLSYTAWMKGRISWPLFLTVVVFVCLSPLSLFLFSQQLQMCLLITILMQAYYHLYRYARKQLSFDLFIFGLLTGLMFYTQFLTVFLIPLFLYALLAATGNSDWKHRGAVLLTGFFPALFLSVSWCYINWMFMKNPFYFVQQWQSAFSPETTTPQALLAAHNVVFAGRLSAHLLAHYSLLLLPYWLVAGTLFFHPSEMRIISMSVLAAPVWLLYLLIAGGNFEFNASYFLLFLTTALLVRIKDLRDINRRWFDRALLLSVVVALSASFWIASGHGSIEEGQFTRGLFQREERSNSNLANYWQVLRHIDFTDPRGKILLDDTRQFPLVLLDGQPQRFILPYEYEFEMVLSEPQLFVRYLVVTEGSDQDRVGGRFPLARFGYVDHFVPVGRFGNLLLFERSDDGTRVQFFAGGEGEGAAAGIRSLP